MPIVTFSEMLARYGLGEKSGVVVNFLVAKARIILKTNPLCPISRFRAFFILAKGL
jgi:hypothetical protein